VWKNLIALVIGGCVCKNIIVAKYQRHDKKEPKCSRYDGEFGNLFSQMAKFLLIWSHWLQQKPSAEIRKQVAENHGVCWHSYLAMYPHSCSIRSQLFALSYASTILSETQAEQTCQYYYQPANSRYQNLKDIKIIARYSLQ
jgi:hypothetical protein